MTYTVEQVKSILITDLKIEEELISIASRIQQARGNGTKVLSYILVSGIYASGISEDVVVGPCSSVSEAPAKEGRIIFGYPLDVNREQAALSQLAAYLAAYFGDNRFAVRVGFSEISGDKRIDHIAAAGWDLDTFVLKEENEAP